MSTEALLQQRKTIRKMASKLRPGSQRRYPTKLRRQIASYARGRLAQGVARATLCEELGVSSPTMIRILSEAETRQGTPGTRKAVAGPPSIRPVRIVAEAIDGGRLVVRGPGGVVVEGLDLDGVVSVLQGLS